jgi:hypothetical protein
MKQGECHNVEGGRRKRTISRAVTKGNLITQDKTECILLTEYFNKDCDDICSSIECIRYK